MITEHGYYVESSIGIRKLSTFSEAYFSALDDLKENFEEFSLRHKNAIICLQDNRLKVSTFNSLEDLQLKCDRLGRICLVIYAPDSNVICSGSIKIETADYNRQTNCKIAQDLKELRIFK